jgi:hypothetical protein
MLLDRNKIKTMMIQMIHQEDDFKNIFSIGIIQRREKKQPLNSLFNYSSTVNFHVIFFLSHTRARRNVYFRESFGLHTFIYYYEIVFKHIMKIVIVRWEKKN